MAESSKAMRRRHTGLTVFLKILIWMGVLSFAGLFFMGWQKANAAEEQTMSTAALYDYCAADAADTAAVKPEKGHNSVKDFLGMLSRWVRNHDTVKDTVRGFYLEDDGLISTACAQEILGFRLAENGNEEDLLKVCTALNGTETQGEPNMEQEKQRALASASTPTETIQPGEESKTSKEKNQSLFDRFFDFSTDLLLSVFD